MPGDFDAGCVRIRLACADGKVAAVKISCERPDVSKVLRGREAGQAVKMIPLLFALCAQAQSRAAVLALNAAHGGEFLPQIDAGVQHEVLREHLWRCLLDLPPLLGAAAMQREFVAAAKWVAEGNRDALHALLAGDDIGRIRQSLVQSNEPLFDTSGLLPVFDARRSLIEWPRLSDEFCRLPNWRGRAAETGAIARNLQRSNITNFPSPTRWQARFDELLDWAAGDVIAGAGGTVSASPVAPGIGRALVQTARGLLMHEIVLDGERVADYFIVAPTEWNFHRHGALHDALLGMRSVDRDGLKRHAAYAIAALDPCVRWELEWE